MNKLGFGLMRLPQKDGAIDIEQTCEMVDLFLEAGCTYFDTAWIYNGSEDAVRKALVERHPRERFLLATKNAAWYGCKTREDAIEQFETSLRRTGAGYFDYYLLHNLGEVRTEYFDRFELWDWARELKAQGKIRNLGFSFHSTPEELDALLVRHPEVDFVQLQINYADWDDPAIQSGACYAVARKHNKPVIVMEPVKGGTLAAPPPAVAQLLKDAQPEMSVASWAVRYAADLDGVMVVLSGMSSVEQMRDNLSYMKDFTRFTDAQRSVIAKAREELKKIPLIPCTTCNYCAKVCPQNIGISGSFAAMNILKLYGNKPFAKTQEFRFVDRAQKAHADACIRCGQCEEVCPQHIAIRDQLAAVCTELLSE